MDIHCPKCGETSMVNTVPEIGQHIICPFCNAKFSYGEQSTIKAKRKPERKMIMATCPYCGFAEPVDECFSGLVGECSKCRGDFTIIPNSKGIPYQPQPITTKQPSDDYNSSDGALGFLMGLFLGFLGVLCAALADKKKYLKGSFYGLIVAMVFWIIVAVLTYSPEQEWIALFLIF